MDPIRHGEQVAKRLAIMLVVGVVVAVLMWVGVIEG